MEKISFYVAGPFFNDEQLSSLETIEALLDKHGFSMFRPRIDAGKLDAHPTKENMKDVFMTDINAIDNCSYVLADITYRDTGTCFEIGYAFSRHIPVILFCNEEKGSKMNLMLAASCHKNFTSLLELDKYLTAIETVLTIGQELPGDVE